MKNIKKKPYNWIIHYVIPTEGDSNTIQLVNAHTHGLEELYSHPEFQIVLPLEQTLVGSLLNDMGMRVANGKQFSDGDVIDDLIMDFPVHLKEVWSDSEHTLLRIILPDPKGLFPWDAGCEEVYKDQYKEGK